MLRRISGSHHIYSKPGKRKVISIPVHGNQTLKTGLALRIARDAGITVWNPRRRRLPPFRAATPLMTHKQYDREDWKTS